jgi:transcriptional regulator with XRE-family HTH domain
MFAWETASLSASARCVTALALGRLRESRAVTQRALADKLAVSQANISRIEHEEDVYISTLRSYVEALGGRLELRAVFDDGTIDIAADGLYDATLDQPTRTTYGD